MARPLISVIMPVYCGEKYLREAIESVLGQSLKNFELLIADDGSTDNSRSIVGDFTDPRIRVLPRGPRLGLFGNLNRLVRSCAAPLIHIFCQDDVLERKCLEEEVSFFIDHPDIGMSYCKSHEIGFDGTVCFRQVIRDLPDVMLPELSTQHFFYHGCIPSNLSTVCVRKSSVEEAGYFNEKLKVSGDYELWSKICVKRPLGVIHEPLVRLRTHPDRLSAQPQSGVLFVVENNGVRKGLIPHLPTHRQRFAKRFEHRRHHVLELHYGIRCLLAGRVGAFVKILRVFGVANSAWALWYWLITLNNSLYRPQAQWVLPKPVGVSPTQKHVGDLAS